MRVQIKCASVDRTKAVNLVLALTDLGLFAAQDLVDFSGILEEEHGTPFEVEVTADNVEKTLNWTRRFAEEGVDYVVLPQHIEEAEARRERMSNALAEAVASLDAALEENTRLRYGVRCQRAVVFDHFRNTERFVKDLVACVQEARCNLYEYEARLDTLTGEMF